MTCPTESLSPPTDVINIQECHCEGHMETFLTNVSNFLLSDWLRMVMAEPNRHRAEHHDTMSTVTAAPVLD